MYIHQIRSDKKRTGTLRYYLRILAAALLVLLVFLPSCLHGKTVLKVGVYNNKPTIFVDDDGVVRGLFIDILENIALLEGWQLEYTVGHFAELFDNLQTSTIDILPAIAYSREREKVIDYTYETVMANWAELYTPAHLKLTSLIELEGKKIGVKQGDIHFLSLKDLVENFNISCRFFEADEYETVFEMLQANYVQVGVVNRLYGNRNKEDFNVQATPVIFNPIEMRYAAPEGKNEEILGKIDTYLTAFKRDENSIYYQAVNRWFVVDSKKRLPGWFLYVLCGVAGVTLFFVGAALLFRRQVQKRTVELTQINVQLGAQIEERKRAEEELRKFARIVEASSDAMALVDKQHCHVLANKTYRRMVADPQRKIEGISLQDLLGSDFFNKELDAPITKCLQGQVVHIQTRPGAGLQANGYWNVTLTPYYSNDGEMTGYVIDIRDVTQHVELQNRLKNAQKMEAIGLLAGGVAHDLNNILSGLVSYPDMLLVNRPPEDPMTVALQTIKKSGERAAAIVQDLLTLARRGIGTVVPLNLNDIVREFIISPEHADIVRTVEGIDYRVGLDENLLNIHGSSVHLSKILMNLFANAVEAMPGGGVLDIATENRFLEQNSGGYEMIPAGEYAAMSVADTGIGMSVAEVNRIFEPFYTSKIMGRSGTGLGMAVVWGAIKDHSGYIDVKSEPGNGTAFTLYFPITRENLPEVEGPEVQHFLGSGQKILVVDDMEDQRILATRILDLLGYHVEVASSGEEAVIKCRETKVDLLILDMIMPGGMDGFATYEKICEFQPGQKAVIASGFSDSTSVQKAQSLGAGAYVKKPYTVKSLGQAIAQELADSAPSQNA